MNIRGGYGGGTLQRRTKPPGIAVSISEVPFGKTTAPTLNIDTFERTAASKPATGGDRFERMSNPFPTVVETAKVRGPEDTLTRLLRDDNPQRRQEAAAFLFQQATGVALSPASTAESLKDGEKAELKTLAHNLQLMTNVQKVDLMHELTGGQSLYTRIAEQVLMQGKAPGMNDILQLGRPDWRRMGTEGVNAAMRAAGIGLLMLPVLCPATLVFRPDLAGQVMAGVGLALL